MNVDKNTKIYVAGHRGLVGSAITRRLRQMGFTNVIGRSHSELDLMDSEAVRRFFDEEKPEMVVLAAAHVGGIMANSVYRADFIFQNLQIQQNVIGEAWKHGVKKLLFLGSTCIYPRMAPQPITEDSLLTSPLEYTNEPYAIAKIAGLKLCESLNLQYGTDYLAVMPTNLYGPGDNFDLVNSHVLPAMMRKMHLAKLLEKGDFAAIRSDLAARPIPAIKDSHKTSEDEISAALASFGIFAGHLDLWGSGSPLREFLWSEDMADASIHVLLNVHFDDLRAACPNGEVRNTHINIGSGTELTIAQLAQMIKEAVGFGGQIRWDSSKPDGTPRKLCDVSKIHSLGWKHKVELPEGISRLYKWYLEN